LVRHNLTENTGHSIPPINPDPTLEHIIQIVFSNTAQPQNQIDLTRCLFHFYLWTGAILIFGIIIPPLSDFRF
jgi:hypothetical protein